MGNFPLEGSMEDIVTPRGTKTISIGLNRTNAAIDPRRKEVTKLSQEAYKQEMFRIKLEQDREVS